MLMESRQQSTDIVAAADGLQSVGRGFLPFGGLQFLPHALGGSRERLGVQFLAAKFCDCLI